jgi:hypothetical protein
MKRLILGVVMLLGACVSEDPTENFQMIYNPNEYQNNNSVNCNTCTGSSYTVRQPIEILYEEKIYTTVYEPKTYVKTNYVRKPYNKCTRQDLCK